jgi:hypothetical protein
MPKVFIESRPRGLSDNDPITDYAAEDDTGHVLRVFQTQGEAVEWAKKQGYMPVIPRVRQLNDKNVAHHWRPL